MSYNPNEENEYDLSSHNAYEEPAPPAEEIPPGEGEATFTEQERSQEAVREETDPAGGIPGRSSRQEGDSGQYGGPQNGDTPPPAGYGPQTGYHQAPAPPPGYYRGQGYRHNGVPPGYGQPPQGYGVPGGYPPPGHSHQGHAPSQPQGYPPAYQPPYQGYTGQGGYPPPGYQPYPGGYPAPPAAYKPPNPYKKPIRRNANIVGVGLIMLFLVGSAFGLLLYGLTELLPPEFYMEHEEVIEGIVDLLVYMGMFLVPCAVMRLWIKMPVKAAYPMRKVKPSLIIPAVFVCLGASFVGSLISQAIKITLESTVGVTPTMPDMSAPYGVGGAVVYFISLALIPAIVEEMMFRGVVMQSLRRFGDGFALIVSSIVFGLAHGNLIQGPTTLLAGLVMGYFVLRTGSLLAGMILHFANNGLVVAVELITMYGSPEAETITSIVLVLIYMVFAAASLGYLLLTQKHMFKTVPSRYPLKEGTKYGMFFSTAGIIIFILGMIAVTAMYFE